MKNIFSRKKDKEVVFDGSKIPFVKHKCEYLKERFRLSDDEIERVLDSEEYASELEEISYLLALQTSIFIMQRTTRICESLADSLRKELIQRLINYNKREDLHFPYDYVFVSMQGEYAGELLQKDLERLECPCFRVEKLDRDFDLFDRHRVVLCNLRLQENRLEETHLRYLFATEEDAIEFPAKYGYRKSLPADENSPVGAIMTLFYGEEE